MHVCSTACVVVLCCVGLFAKTSFIIFCFVMLSLLSAMVRITEIFYFDMYKCIYMYMYICMYTCNLIMYTYIHVYTCMCRYIHVHVLTCITLALFLSVYILRCQSS